MNTVVTPHVNIDFGLGGWGGRVLNYSKYTNFYDNELIETGAKNFIFVDNVIIAVSYIF